MSTEKVVYSDEELQEFKELILQKLEQATADYERLRDNAVSAGNDVVDTQPTFKNLGESAVNLSRGENGRMAERLMKFIQGLQGALTRIDNKTYGICRVTGKLIPKERLRAVPHTTQSIEAKLGETK